MRSPMGHQHGRSSGYTSHVRAGRSIDHSPSLFGLAQPQRDGRVSRKHRLDGRNASPFRRRADQRSSRHRTESHRQGSCKSPGRQALFSYPGQLLIRRTQVRHKVQTQPSSEAHNNAGVRRQNIQCLPQTKILVRTHPVLTHPSYPPTHVSLHSHPPVPPLWQRQLHYLTQQSHRCWRGPRLASLQVS